MTNESTSPVTNQDTTSKPFTNRRLKALLRALGACSEGRDWLGNRDLAAAWAECERGDWLVWLAAKLSIERRMIVIAAARCAETALQFVPEGEDRPRLALEAAMIWANDPTEVNMDRVRVARRNAYAAYAAYAADAYAYASASAAAAAASDAAYASDAAAAAASAASDAAYAAYASDAAASDARQKAQQRHAEIVREVIPFAVILAAVSERAS